jgi:hypothetical protein
VRGRTYYLHHSLKLHSFFTPPSDAGEWSNSHSGRITSGKEAQYLIQTEVRWTPQQIWTSWRRKKVLLQSRFGHGSTPSLLYNGYLVSFPGVNRPGCGVHHPPPSSAEVMNGAEPLLPYHTGMARYWAYLYLYLLLQLYETRK